MFTESVYQTIRDGCERSAAAIVPDIMQIIAPHSVTDYGCGEGIWLAEFARHGCEIQGIDNGHGQLAIPADRFTSRDLATCDNPLLPATDLAVCLETAEHLPPERADWLVDLLCETSQVVLFSAAIPGQGGHGHINEQWPDYWFDKFDARCYAGTGWLRWLYWDRAPHDIEPWYAQNLFLYAEDKWLDSHPSAIDLWDHEVGDPVRVIHPVVWDAKR
jgi:SAM-dependent methyltransferase